VVWLVQPGGHFVIASSLESINYTLIRNNKWGRLRSPAVIDTGITGFTVTLDEPNLYAKLTPDGLLWVGAGTEWDFGSGPAVNTPEMVRASLPHDIFCIMTDRGLLPWSVRAKADKLLHDMVRDLAPKRKWHNPLRYWYKVRWVGVVCYSQGIARWRAQEYIEA